MRGRTEEALAAYLSSGAAADAPFDIGTVSLEKKRAVVTTKKGDEGRPKPMQAAAESSDESYAEQLAQIPEFVEYGPLFVSSKPIELTESETEYTVNCVVHTFPEHFVLQVCLCARRH